MILSEAEADARAARCAEKWPTATMACSGCQSSFPLVDADGHASMTCVMCVSADRVWMVSEGAAATAAEAEPEREAEGEPDPTEGRCDPASLDDVIGNAASVRWLRTMLDAFEYDLAQLDGRTREAKTLPFPHTVLTGSGGTGKTMMAEIIAREIDRPICLQMGQSLTSPGRVGDVLLSLKAGDVLFIDEIHGLKTACQEALYRAMEDRVYVPVAKAGAPVVAPIRLPPFTLIGSTTDEWGLLPSLLQRFKIRLRLERMTADELARAMLERAARKMWPLTPEAAAMIGLRAHGTPRIAISLLDGCLAVAKAQGETEIDEEIVTLACTLLEIDELGLDAVARKYLGYLADGGGKPVRVNVLATRLDGLSRRTVELRIEPDLVWLGLVEKGSNGRLLTEEGREYVRGGK